MAWSSWCHFCLACTVGPSLLLISQHCHRCCRSTLDCGAGRWLFTWLTLTPCPQTSCFPLCRSKLQLRGWKVVVTGHSLGAAVATLLGMQLRERFAGEPRRSPDCSACVLGLWPRCRACSCGSGLRVSRCYTLHTRFRAALLGLQPAGAASRTYLLLANAYVVE